MKPDWKDAPEWATALAQDKDARWWWYEKTPEPNGDYFSCKGEAIEAYPVIDNWKNTLEFRPK